MNPSPLPPEELVRVRQQINRADRRLLALLARRLRLARRAGRVKAAAGVPIRDPAREEEVRARARAYAREHGMDGERLAEIVCGIIEWCAWEQETRTDLNDGGEMRRKAEGVRLLTPATECPKCGKRPGLRITEDERELHRDAPPEKMALSFQCQNPRCRTHYPIPAEAYQRAA